ncbi:MAG TPA: DUF2268 domain-containing putative Zn-dependent protease [Prolixibacteraceae bacterium]|nr:DUF2268 domain-containing putative Zn-dependent protease [Prolixibacteraceae bacterium]
MQLKIARIGKAIGVMALLAGVFLLLSCERNPLKVDLSGIGEEVSFVRYDRELFSLGGAPGIGDLQGLHDRYPAFTDLYTHLVLRVGDVTDSSGWQLIREFLADTTTQAVREMAEKRFSELRSVEKELVTAFKHFRYHFPERPLPVVYFCQSGFNESVFTADSLVGISLDKYLGPGCFYYDMLDLPRYKQRKMIPAMIPSDVMYTWGMTEFPLGKEATTLLDHMVHEGKLLYFMEAMLPREADTLRTGFSKRQLEWCRSNETAMWNYLVEHQMLFSTRQMDIVRYINDGPTTNGFPQESPARTGAWLGRQIVRAYMKKNPQVTLAELMANTAYRQILNGSAYAPQ